MSGFSETVDIRVHSGDLDLGSGASITANGIDLTADAGTVDIAGTLNAPSAAQRGSIVLSGGNAVIIEATAQLHADGSGSAGRGGEIDLTRSARIAMPRRARAPVRSHWRPAASSRPPAPPDWANSYCARRS